MESITTDYKMFWPGRPLLVSRARHSGFRGGWKGGPSGDFCQVFTPRWNATIMCHHSTYQCVSSWCDQRAHHDYDGKARQAAHLVDRWKQTVAKGLAASCGEDYEHIAPAYQIQYHFLLLVQISE